jgi:hypothetical protein
MGTCTKLINRVSVCVGLLLSTGIADAQVITFEKGHGGSGTDSGRSIEFTSDGGYITAGHTTTNSVGFADLFVVRTDAYGDTLWTKKYGGNGVEAGFTIQKVSDGNYIIAGYSTSYSNGTEDALLMKIDEAGSVIWQKTYGGTYHDRIEAAYQTADGGIIMVGNSNSAPSTSVDVYLIKADAQGNEVWSKRFGGSAYDSGNMVQPTSDGGYIIIGQTMSFGSGAGDYWMIKTDASGNMQWDKTFGGPNIDEGKNIRQTADGGYIITGDTDSYGMGNSDIYLIKTDGSGNVQWSKTFGGTAKDVSKMVEPTPDGGYIIAGITRSFGLVNPDAWIIKTNASGDSTWTRMYGSWDHEHLYAIRPTPDGGYIGVGHSDSYAEEDYEQVYMLKLDGNGNTTVGIEDEPFAVNIMNVYPNPTNGPFEVEIDLNGAPSAEIRLINASGQTVMQERIENNNGTFHKKLDLAGFSKGIYLLGVTVNDQRSTRKIMVY